MTAVTGPGRRAIRKVAPSDPVGYSASAHSSAVNPNLPFTALIGLCGLAVPFVLAFALRADIAELAAPASVQYLADGGYVLVNLFFVVAGFLLCRPLRAVLARTGTRALLTGLARQIAPLHLAAWTITAGWLLTGTAPGTIWSWASSALLLNGVAGPEQAGYPMSWSVSVALFSALLLVLVALALTLRPFRRSRKADGIRVIPKTPLPGANQSPAAGPGRLLTGIASTAILIGAAALIFTGPDANGTVGLAAIGPALLGFGTGMLSFRVLEGGTGTLRAPLSGSVPASRPTPGLGALLALAALLLCIYRSDLVHEFNLLPIFPVAAALVYFLALPHATGQSPVNRVLDAGPMQWLGSRALAIYLLHGPVQLTVGRIGELRGLDPESTSVAYATLGLVVVGSLIAAELGYRLLEHPSAPPKPVPVEAISIYRLPPSRPERVSQIDQDSIPSELRLRPLPRKATSTPEKPVTDPQTAPTAEPSSTEPISLPVAAADKPLADRPVRKSVRRPAAKAIKLPADKPVRKSAARKPAAKATESIDLDQAAKAADSETQVLDADDKTLDAPPPTQS